MSPELKQVLLNADEHGAYEFPSHFDAEDIERRARVVLSDLSSAGFGGTFEGFVHNQDASFGLAILLDPFEKVTGAYRFVPGIRFSNFGNLATVCLPDLLSPACIAAIGSALKDSGFTLVPADVLSETTYDGVNAPNEAFPNWWVRYFDWL